MSVLGYVRSAIFGSVKAVVTVVAAIILLFLGLAVFDKAWPLLFFFGGLIAIYGGFEDMKERQLMKDVPQEDIESLSVGPTYVKGKAVPAPDEVDGEEGERAYGDFRDDVLSPTERSEDLEAALRAPFTGEPSIAAIWTISEWEKHSDSEGGTYWDWSAKRMGLDVLPFYVDDGTGRVLVRPKVKGHGDSDPAIDLKEGDDNYQVEVGKGEEPPEEVRDFIERRLSEDGGSGDDSDGGFIEFNFDAPISVTSDKKRKYEQVLVKPGDEMSVFGDVRPRGGVSSSENPENLVIENTGEGETSEKSFFLVSDKTKDELIEDRGNRDVAFKFLIGIVFSALGLYFWLMDPAMVAVIIVAAIAVYYAWTKLRGST